MTACKGVANQSVEDTLTLVERDADLGELLPGRARERVPRDAAGIVHGDSRLMSHHVLDVVPPAALQPDGPLTVDSGAAGSRYRGDGKCCKPTYQAHVFDARTGKRIRRTFLTRSAAKLWPQDAMTALRQGDLSAVAPAGRTVADALDELLDGMRDGSILDRSSRRTGPPPSAATTRPSASTSRQSSVTSG